MTLTDSELRDAIEMCGKATNGPCGHCTLPKFGIILPKTGFMASRFWADTSDPQTGRDAEMLAFFGTHGESLLRELEKERARNEELVKAGRNLQEARRRRDAGRKRFMREATHMGSEPSTVTNRDLEVDEQRVKAAESAFDALLSPRLEDRKETT